MDGLKNKPDPKGPSTASPYSSGGGGVTFERKVAVQYLGHLLLGDGAPELGDGRFAVSVAFQQAPEHAVDDLVIRAIRADESQPSLVLAIGVRRAPDLVQSDEATEKLIRGFVSEVMKPPADGPELRVALVVAGVQDHAKQLAVLADLAAKHSDAATFFALLRTPGKFSATERGRLDQTEALVRLALVNLGLAEPAAQLVQQHTWHLLSRLTVLMPRLETPDETDWAGITNALVPVARGADLEGASRLRDRLVALAGEYAPKGATVDLTLLRRDAHQALDATKRHHQKGWQALVHLHARAVGSVRAEITSGDGVRTVHLKRGSAAAELLSAASSHAALVVHGESGVGKSALVVNATSSAENVDLDTTQALCMNLRHLPEKTLELESHLGSPLAALLPELSAPQRLLVIDGADAAGEGRLELFRYLVDSATRSGVTVIAVTASHAKQVVRETLAELCGDVADYVVTPLTDAQVDEVVATFAELSALAKNPRSREVLRRPVVVDLLVRGGLVGVPLSDADAMRLVWSGLVRRHEQSDRGTPDARELALLRLADLALSGGDALPVLGTIDSTALDGLRRDGLLRTSPEDPFRIGPEFAHDEVRRYAIARLLLAAGDPAERLVRAGAPRWALSAARLACQALFAATDTTSNPLRGRFARLQKAFDGLVDAGQGDRWGDVPGEALLTLDDPDPVLRDAWPGLRAEPGAGLQRLSRLVDQRLRDENGLVRIVAVEPLINRLLGEPTPRLSGEHVQELLKDWLRALIGAGTLAGHTLRIRLCNLLVAGCAAADRRMGEEREAEAAARAARSPEEIEKERKLMERHWSLMGEIGYPRWRRRERPRVPHEITDETTMELLALLGPDLGDLGEAALRRVAQDAPAWLGPAVEEPLTGSALAMCRRGFLSELTEAYYLDDEEDGTGFHEDGIRHHLSRGFGVVPLAAWYRGPFMALFQSDFRNGVAVLNRMLNHAALARARTLAGLDHQGAPGHDCDLDAYRTELDITGTRRVYAGDAHVWMWYRGTGVGPYPCMSGLQALERVCDKLIEIGMPLANIIAILLEECGNLAMVGLVIGLLVRHLERAGQLLDRYLAEPIVWHLEFSRVAGEGSGLAAPSSGLVAAERRRWSLREAAVLLVLRADEERAHELRIVGEQLVRAARRLIVDSRGDADGVAIEEELVTVRAWACSLDRTTYQAHEAKEGIYIQSTPPDDIVKAMKPGSDEVQRAQEGTRLIVRYCVEPRKGKDGAPSPEDLAADLAIARGLLENPPALSAGDQWDTPAAVAAAALEAHLLRGMGLPDEGLRFAVSTVLHVGMGEASPRQFEFEESYFELGADRSAARVIPLLLLPSAASLCALADGGDGSKTRTLAAAAARKLALAVANEVRVHLARGLDRVWEAPCTDSSACHHDIALQLAIDTMRDCAFGAWDPASSRRRPLVLADPIEQPVAETAGEAIYLSRLDAAVRALAPAANAGVCVSRRARDLLMVLLAAHRRALLAHEHDMDTRGTHALVAARALLTIAADGDDAAISEHLDAYADSAILMASFLRALSAAAEESPQRAVAAERIWPTLVSSVIALHESGHEPFRDRHYGDHALAALMPNATSEVAYLYREIETAPVVWWRPLAWQSTVEKWLPLATGNPTCVDHLVGFVRVLAPEAQARVALPWVAALVLADPVRVASGSFLVATWLIELRSAACDTGLLANWQRVVDALVVAGVTRLAPYSE